MMPEVRKVVILAAGQGSRLNNSRGTPKPLMPVYGLPLIERVIATCQEVGLPDFIVVTGYCAERVESFLIALAQRRRVNIQIIHNPLWDRGNGTSALACQKIVQEPFILLMCDHLFEPALLKGLLNGAIDGDTCWLVVDGRVNTVFDIDDASKVMVDVAGNIRRAGKNLRSYNAIDTGIFLCTPVLFDALAFAQQSEQYQLLDGIQVLADWKKIRAHTDNTHYWLDVDTPDAVEECKGWLRYKLAKPQQDGFISRYLNRPVSTRLSLLLSHTPIMPNHITLFCFFLGLISAGLFILSHGWVHIVAGLLVQFVSIIDGVDGEIARLKHLRSFYGAWLDTILDRYVDVALSVGITYGYWLSHPDSPGWVWLLGVIALSGYLMVSYNRKEYQLRYNEPPPAGVFPYPSRDIRLFIIFCGAILNQAYPAMVLIGIASHLKVASRLIETFYLEIKQQQSWELAG